MTRTLPLFPLPLVLFPGAELPLHVFEPRYRRLLADVLAGDRTFGIVLREPDVAERDLPAGHVGCEARVLGVDMLPDGRANLVVRGGERFALDGLVERDAPYLVGAVSSVHDVEEPAALVEPIAERVRARFSRVAAAARALEDDTDPVPPLPDDARLLAFAIAAVVELDLAARQRILASRSAAARLAEVDRVLADAVDGLERRAEVHRRAKTNGHAGSGAHGAHE